MLVMLKLYDSNSILLLRNFDIDTNINLDLSFASNQTSNIFYFKILYALVSAFDFLYINSDIIFYTLALAFFPEKVLRIL